MIEMVNEALEDFNGDACLVKKGESYFVVSSIDLTQTVGLSSGMTLEIRETMVFPADEEGNVTDWIEVTGGKDWTREQAIEALEEIDA